MRNLCAEYDHLESVVERALAKVAEVSTLQLELFRSRKFSKVMSVDKRLENLVGEKERAIGALHQHVKEHHCQAEDSM
jgi:hypothetical protein